MNSLDEARQIVAEATRTPIETLPHDADILSLSAWDSIAHVNIILAIEARTGHQLTAESIVGIHSVETVAQLLSEASRSPDAP